MSIWQDYWVNETIKRLASNGIEYVSVSGYTGIGVDASAGSHTLSVYSMDEGKVRFDLLDNKFILLKTATVDPNKYHEQRRISIDIVEEFINIARIARNGARRSLEDSSPAAIRSKAGKVNKKSSQYINAREAYVNVCSAVDRSSDHVIRMRFDSFFKRTCNQFRRQSSVHSDMISIIDDISSDCGIKTSTEVHHVSENALNLWTVLYTAFRTSADYRS